MGVPRNNFPGAPCLFCHSTRIETRGYLNLDLEGLYQTNYDKVGLIPYF